MSSADSASPRSIVYRLWNGVLPAAVCDSVIDVFDDPATGGPSDTFIEPGHWTGALVSHFAHQANLLWKYQIAGLGTLSIVRDDTDGLFNWHVDVLNYDRTDYGMLGEHLERKLSVTVNLSDPDTYEGGDLEFLNSVGELLTQPELRERGSVVVFPSTVGHRVTPVTAGVRYALVGWMVGPPLR